MSAPKEILDLVERYQRNREEYESGKYNETQLRREFLDPFFKTLGWDVTNEKGYSEAYKEVIHEDAIKIGAATKAPDYCFRIGGIRKFFLEAKKPSVNIKDDLSPAFQLRRYAWSAKLPLSILSDFEELAVYDCRVKPHQTDKPSTARILYFTFDQYAEKWDEIAAIFSPDAVLKGSFDKYADSSKSKKGTTTVDEAFLEEIENWRKELAKNIAAKNSKLSIQELNFSVQKIIDRIIFLRICEDRGIEPYGKLLALVNGTKIYDRLTQAFQRADERYNSGLFHFQKEKDRPEQPDELTLKLKIDDKDFKDMIGGLYYPESPYEFSALPADILGQVYEQFLGKVIRLTDGHQAKIEDKPEVKKAGGVFYTPTYVVEYIVKNTVGKLCEGKTTKQVAKLRVLDPACGSGSFLIGAYQYLLNWHLEWYLKDGPEKYQKELYQGPGGDWRLTTETRKKILLNNIYGVDIDSQAVEVTKLSLLLKVLEGESEQTLKRQLEIFHQRALPDLGSNIKCGNSLVGMDYFSGQLLADINEMRKVNPFDWEKEFSEIKKPGGFNCLIGNPPYGAFLSENEITYLERKTEESSSHDSYEYFLLLASKLLTGESYISMIIPASWMTSEKYTGSRKKLFENFKPIVAYAMPFDVFKDAYIDTSIVVLTNSSDAKTCLINYFPKKEKLSLIPNGIGKPVSVENIQNDSLKRLSIVLADETNSIMKKLKNAKLTFGDWFNIQRGVQPYSRKKHTESQINSRFLHAAKKINKEYLPELQGNELARYWVDTKRTSYIRYCDEIASSRTMDNFTGKRIVLRRLLTRQFRLQASTTDETLITTDNVLNLTQKMKDADITFALGVLNSKFISWLYVNTSMIAQKDDFPQVHISALSEIPIPYNDEEKIKELKTMVGRIIEVNKRVHENLIDVDIYKRQLEALDKEVDQLVYNLYELKDEEIRIIEGVS